MKPRSYEIRKSAFGFSQDCKFSISNHHSGAVINVTSAEWPVLLKGHGIVAYLLGRYSRGHWEKPNEYNLNSHANGWVDERIIELEKDIEELKFLQKIARRKSIGVSITNSGAES